MPSKAIVVHLVPLCARDTPFHLINAIDASNCVRVRNFYIETPEPKTSTWWARIAGKSDIALTPASLLEAYEYLLSEFVEGDDICLLEGGVTDWASTGTRALAEALETGIPLLGWNPVNMSQMARKLPIRLIVVGGMTSPNATLGLDPFALTKIVFNRQPLAQHMVGIGIDQSRNSFRSYHVTRTSLGTVKSREEAWNLPYFPNLSYWQNDVLNLWILHKTHSIIEYTHSWATRAALFGVRSDWEEIMHPSNGPTPTDPVDEALPLFIAKWYRLQGYQSYHSKFGKFQWLVWLAFH